MRHSKEKTAKKSPVLLTILLLALLGLSVSGVRAYLLHADEAVSNTFIVEQDPQISINKDYQVSVQNTAYPVYLRAAIVVNWKKGNSILATDSTGYTPILGEGWFEHQGFYYYTQQVNADEETTALITNPPSEEQDGYTLTADVAVQAIQAIGTTDGNNPVDAVKDAWGISGQEIKNLGTP